MMVVRKLNRRRLLMTNCDCREENHNKLELILVLAHTLKITKLAIILFSLTYLLGMLWLVFIKGIEDF